MKNKNAQKTLVGNVDPDVLSFTIGKDPLYDVLLAEWDCIGTAAHVTMLSKIKNSPAIFTDSQKKKVVVELLKIVDSIRNGKFAITDSDQDVHLAVERILTSKLGDLGRKVHTGRSRNDQSALDLRLYGKNELFKIFDVALSLVDTILKFSKKYKMFPMVGRTHTQPAMPSSVGLWASAHAESLLDDIELLVAAFEYNDKSPLGSAAGYGVPLDIDRNLTARLLGFKEPVHNVIYAGNARGKCESVILSALSQVMMTLSRFASDLILYSLPEFGYFSIPSEYCTGSSIMPQKKNPDVLELIRAKASVILGYSSIAAGVVNSLCSGYNRDVQEIKGPFVEGLDLVRTSLSVMDLLFSGVEANKDALLAGFTPAVFATDYALELSVSGLPFRDAYNKVKLSLNDLAEKNPCDAVACKTHLGATGGLDLTLLKSRSSVLKKMLRTKRGKFHSSLSSLLGIRYPDLKKN